MDDLHEKAISEITTTLQTLSETLQDCKDPNCSFYELEEIESRENQIKLFEFILKVLKDKR